MYRRFEEEWWLTFLDLKIGKNHGVSWESSCWKNYPRTFLSTIFPRWFKNICWFCPKKSDYLLCCWLGLITKTLYYFGISSDWKIFKPIQSWKGLCFYKGTCFSLGWFQLDWKKTFRICRSLSFTNFDFKRD